MARLTVTIFIPHHVRLSDNGPVGFGKSGSFEGFCSGGGIAQLATTMALEKLQCGYAVGYCKTKSDLASITAKSVSDAAEAGDPVAIAVYHKVGQYLGMGLSILIDILNPEKIVIGSIFCRSHKLMWQSAQQVLQKEAIAISNSVCKVVPAMLGDSVGDFAAVTVALCALQNA